MKKYMHAIVTVLLAVILNSFTLRNNSTFDVWVYTMDDDSEVFNAMYYTQYSIFNVPLSCGGPSEIPCY